MSHLLIKSPDPLPPVFYAPPATLETRGRLENPVRK
jgi:hypothetical protein